MNASATTEQHTPVPVPVPVPAVTVVNGDNVDNDVNLDDMIPDSQTDAPTSLKSEILDSASTRVEISTPLDPESIPIHPPSGTPRPQEGQLLDDVKMSEETPEVVDGLETMNQSSDVPTTNGASNGVNGIHSTDADGDVHMEQSPTTNGHGDITPRQSSLPAVDSAPSRATSNFDYPQQHSNTMDDDDEARPPPAKRARKYSDADQASIANVSTSVAVRLQRRANSACLLSYPRSADPEDWLSPSCYSVLCANQW
ncbi:hypothetical protein K503DRAFT_117071 [Rhizopogon vinicolor AM-OR11-026]|uniref:Uncharacterized protein n=1 Tax=Rhizopogon vinicolor AM-OR11-026 TaxID=1314800 RepID=A0A1B7N2F1_9AGAM|nr:hypothetical protein K503DRAFT_117071 [Rhizopogon vinicolor AM-OR11-026]